MNELIFPSFLKINHSTPFVSPLPPNVSQQEDLVVLLGDISPLPVTYAGGARSIEDLQRVTELGRGKVRTCTSSSVVFLIVKVYMLLKEKQ